MLVPVLLGLIIYLAYPVEVKAYEDFDYGGE